MKGNPWLDRRVLNYAHQGGAREAPSSTLFALREAVSRGADALELDVHATLDGELVVCHDATVDRTTNGSGAIAAMKLSEVQALDNAYWWVDGEIVATDREPAAYVHRGKAPDDRDFRVASLREVLEAFPGTLLNLDIKQTAPDVEPYEEALARLLQEYDRSDDVIVASFLDAATASFKAHAPEIHTSMGTLATTALWQAVQDGDRPDAGDHVALQVPHRFGDIVVVDDRFVDAAHDAHVAVHVWTIDDEPSMTHLLDLGVDGIMTDVPSVLETVLRRERAPRITS